MSYYRHFSLLALLLAAAAHAQETPIAPTPVANQSPGLLPAVSETSPASYENLQRELFDLRREVTELREWQFQQPSYFVSSSAAEHASPPSASSDPDPTTRYPTVTVNGVFQADVGFFHQDDASLARFGEIQDGADFRRARLSAKGSVSETVNYMMQFDFAFAGRPTFTDVWMETVDLPYLGNLRIGQWKQPFSLEVVSSFRYTTFMERSLVFIPFTPFRHLGIGFYDHAENHSSTWAASAFRSGQDQFGGSISTDGGWGTAERVTWLPWYDEPSGGVGYLHLGLGHFYSNPPNDTFNFRTIPEFFVGEQLPGSTGTSGSPIPGALNGTPFFAATGPLQMHQYNVVGSELLLVAGPFSFQTEAMFTAVDQLNGPTANLSGGYAQVGYFLTGEHRPYDRKTGAIDRVMPFENFFRVGTCDGGVATGCGAWEVAFRLSYIDLNDANVTGGQLTDATAGVNWYWNPYSKLVFNYIHAFAAHPTLGDSETDIFAARAQIDF